MWLFTPERQISSSPWIWNHELQMGDESLLPRPLKRSKTYHYKWCRVWPWHPNHDMWVIETADTLDWWTYYSIRQVGIKNAFLFIILSVNLQKVWTEIVDNGFEVVGAIAVWSYAAWDGNGIWMLTMKVVRDLNLTHYLLTRTPLANLVCKTSDLSACHMSWITKYSSP